MNKLLITAALIAATVATGTMKANAAETGMTASFARIVGEVNAAVGQCDYELRNSASFMADVPSLYLNENRKDLLAQSMAASAAFHARYKANPISACNQARAAHGGYLKAR